MKVRIKRGIWVLVVLAVIGTATVLGINGRVVLQADQKILEADDALLQELDADCIIVLGCQVFPDGGTSLMLRDRLERGIELYHKGVSEKILMSGDHGRVEYDEVNTMKNVAIEGGVPSEDVFMDHAGFSTYETMYRAKEIFQAKKVVIVTQEYHLYRAVYIANSLGLDAYGVATEDIAYAGQMYRDMREVLARIKDFGYCVFRPEPTYLGDVIPVTGDGNMTND